MLLVEVACGLRVEYVYHGLMLWLSCVLRQIVGLGEMQWKCPMLLIQGRIALQDYMRVCGHTRCGGTVAKNVILLMIKEASGTKTCFDSPFSVFKLPFANPNSVKNILDLCSPLFGAEDVVLNEGLKFLTVAFPYKVPVLFYVRCGQEVIGRN